MSGDNVDLPWRIVADGVMLHVRATPKASRNAVKGIERMAVEIGKREAELQRLSMVIEQSPESIVMTDTAGSILYVNAAFQRITGYAREEVLGRNPRILNGGLTPSATCGWVLVFSTNVVT